MKITLFGPQEREEIAELIGRPEDFDISGDDYSVENHIGVTCRIIRNNDLARVEGEVSALLNAQCARCLEHFEKKILGAFSFVVKRLPLGAPIPGESKAETEDDEDIINVGHDVFSFDITDYVREAVILALPMKMLCREDCKGLCAVCGGNLNDISCGCKPESPGSPLKKLEKIFEEK